MRSSVLLALLPLAMAAPSTKRDSPAPVLAPRGAAIVPGKYIVKMKDNTFANAVDLAISKIKADADHTYTHFHGFAATLTDAEVELLANDASVSTRSTYKT